MTNLLMLVAVFLALALLYRFRLHIARALARFDAQNRARRMTEITERFDRNAHYRHTVALAEEQFEAVQKVTRRDERTGSPVERFIFLGDEFATQSEANAARQEAVLASARQYYKELERTPLGQRHRDRTVSAPGEDAR